MKTLCIGLMFLIPVLSIAQDHWSKVPAAPTGCYSSKDDFRQKAEAYKAQLNAVIQQDLEKRTAHLKNMSQEEMLAYAAQQQNASAANVNEQYEFHKQTEAYRAKAESIEAEFNALRDSYLEETSKKLDPLLEENVRLAGSDNSAVKSREILSKYDREYEAICTKYFTGPSASFKAYLAKFKLFIQQDDIPFMSKTHNMQFRQIGQKTDESIIAMTGVSKYLEKMLAIYNERKENKQLE